MHNITEVLVDRWANVTERGKVTFGWTTWCAMDQKRLLTNVGTAASHNTTVHTRKMSRSLAHKQPVAFLGDFGVDNNGLFS